MPREASGIPDEDIKKYILAEKATSDEHRELWRELLTENNLNLFSIFGILNEDKNAVIEQIMGKRENEPEPAQPTGNSEKFQTTKN